MAGKKIGTKDRISDIKYKIKNNPNFLEDAVEAIDECQKLIEYYQFELEEAEENAGKSEIDSYHHGYYVGKAEAYTDHIFETANIMHQLKGTKKR